MQLQKIVQEIFLQLSDPLKKITDKQYTFESVTLSGATIGQHTRHIIEMFICLEEGYISGIVNYENRKREKVIETNRFFALNLLEGIGTGLNKPDRPLILCGEYCADDEKMMEFSTNYYREIVYNLEHAIHHMALIKIGVSELTDIRLPEGFGVASSTTKYKNECAQ